MSAELLSLGSTLLNNFFAGSRQDDAQDFSAHQFATRYQTTVKDLEAAGLNPMLAYSQGGGSAPTSSAASAAAGSDLGMVNLQSKITAAQEANLAAQTRKTNAEAAVTEQFGIQQAQANLDSTLSGIGLTAAQTAKVNADTDNAVATLRNIKLEGDRLIKAANLLFEQANESFARQLTESQRYEMLKAQARLYVSQAGLNQLDLDAANKLENSGRIGREIKPFFDMIRSILRK